MQVCTTCIQLDTGVQHRTSFFPCLALGVQSISKLTERFGLAKRTSEWNPYSLYFNNILMTGYYISSVKIMAKYNKKDFFSLNHILC